MATIWREDWGCAAGVPEVVVLRGADVAEEERFARCLSLLASLWWGTERGRGEEGGRNKRKGATVGEEGKGRRNRHEVKLHSFVIRHFGSMYPQLVVLWSKLVQLILQHPHTLSGEQVGRQWKHAAVTSFIPVCSKHLLLLSVPSLLQSASCGGASGCRRTQNLKPYWK